jgi:thiosulfate/3-mercaptopyruvate sulfurtransferase
VPDLFANGDYQHFALRRIALALPQATYAIYPDYCCKEPNMTPASQDDPKTLVSTDWLAQHIKGPDLRIIDASWHMPATGRDAQAEYESAHIPGARFFDIEDISDHRSDLPHMAPPVEKFISRMRAMGIGDGHQVVVYDSTGLFSAARVWWTFRLMGKMEDLPPMVRDRHITVQRQSGLVKDVTQVAQASKLAETEIIDARAAARFKGEVAEPREGLRSGHIPNSKNLPYGTLLNDDGTMKAPAQLQAAFEAAGVDLSKPAITTCGSGITAAILSLGLERIGHRDHALYDGSWSEWGMYDDLPIAKG